MNEIKIFESEQFGAVRTLVNNETDEVLFCLKDVCVALLLDAKQVVRRLEKGVFSKHPLLTDGGIQELNFVNEDGLYDVILDSRKPEAKAFRKWVTSEVLPQIRQTGGYIPVNAQDDDQTVLSRALLIMQRTLDQKDKLISQQDKLLEEQKPAVQFANAVSSCPDSILVRDLAKLITQNGVKIGQGRLFYWLRLHGYLFKNETRPIQKWVEQGLFDTNITLVETNHGTKERCTTKVTGRGQRYFVEGFVSGRFKAGNQDLN